MSMQTRTWPFTTRDLRRMLEIGILREDQRVELLEGELRMMTPIGPLHAGIVDRLNALIHQRTRGQVILRIQSPVHLDDHSEPQPDLALLRPREDYYATQHPGPADVLLVIEVAATSLEIDRDDKLPRYAQAGIPEVWLVDCEQEIVWQHFGPSASGYTESRRIDRSDSIESQSVRSLQLSGEEIFGPRP